MGKSSILTKEQKIVLEEFKDSRFLSSNFYFTGGTALSEFYLRHRLSDDLDFFTEDKFDFQDLFEIVNSWSRKHKLKVKSEIHGLVSSYFFEFKTGHTLKVDYAQYPHRRLERLTNFGGVRVDSLYDIAVNKLLMINQRANVKDFVDLYFLFNDFNFWQLKDGVVAKFNMELDLYYTAVDFMKVEGFRSLPKMIKPLKLAKLKSFFRERARELGYEALK